MLRRVKPLFDYALAATDGELGRVTDMYFDDQSWIMRYLVADTSAWLPGRLVLIGRESLDAPSWNTRRFPIRLSRQQVEQSPSIETDKPISRLKEEELRKFYHWPKYWGAVEPFISPAATTQAEVEAALRGTWSEPSSQSPMKAPADESGLRSVQELLHYSVHSMDGHVGHVGDFVIDDESWVIRYLVIDSRHWLPGKQSLMAPTWIHHVSWAERRIHLDLPAETVKHSPPFDPEQPLGRTYEVELFKYYGKPEYWT